MILRPCQEMWKAREIRGTSAPYPTVINANTGEGSLEDPIAIRAEMQGPTPALVDVV